MPGWTDVGESDVGIKADAKTSQAVIILNRIIFILDSDAAPHYLDREVKGNDMSNGDNHIVRANDRIIRRRLANHSDDHQPGANPSRDHQPYSRASVGWRGACVTCWSMRGRSCL